MADEFQESDVFFSTGKNETDYHSDSGEFMCSDDISKLKRKNCKAINSKKSAPVNIPCSISWIQYVERDFINDFDCRDGEIVPPHVIIRRRVADKMAFSVCSGNGRTLKGRDLSQVRNSILRMTGFIEA